ncbi:MAG TPA: hypothetical protein VF815_37125 [Myxococcaceae bacterium]|jgi:hypothetical protein
MKRLLLSAVLAASSVSCVEGNRAVQILQANELGADCSAGEAVLNGFLNYDLSNAYLANFSIFSPVQATGNNRLDFFGQEIVLNYESENPSVNFTEEAIPVHLVVSAGETDSNVVVNLIGDKARARLENAVPTFPDVMTLLASMRIRGEMSSGSSVETNEVTFPIQITRAGSPCPAGKVLTPEEGTCSNPGQNGQSYTCEDPPAP